MKRIRLALTKWRFERHMRRHLGGRWKVTRMEWCADVPELFWPVQPQLPARPYDWAKDGE
jgi:hypothetical protein